MKASQDFGIFSADVVVVLGQVGEAPVGKLVSVVQLKHEKLSEQIFNSLD